MNRRQLIKQSALAVGAFAAARETFAREIFPTYNDPIFRDNAAGPIKLSANENPHGPSPLAKKAMYDAIDASNRYQWDINVTLREQIGKLTDHTKDHIILGAGSSELLGLVTLFASQKKGSAVAAEPTFKLWMPATRKMGLPIQLVPTTTAKENDLPAMFAAIKPETRLVYLCNPNNPTGTVSPEAELENFIKKVPGDCIILLDEAYTDYYNSPSMAHMVNDFPNLVIAKTFSKVYGMAGARLGYVIAQPNMVQQLMQLQAWANAGPSYVSMQGGLAVMQDAQFIALCKSENIKAKEVFYKGLQQLGIPYIKSYTSFVYFNAAAYKKDFAATLQAANIIGARSFEEKSTWLRLSIGTVAEMEKVVLALNS